MALFHRQLEQLSVERTTPGRYSQQPSPLFRRRGLQVKSTPVSQSPKRKPVPASARDQSRPHLRRLRTRVKETTEPAVTADLAAKVVKDYLLPLFAANSRHTASKSREMAFGLDVSLPASAFHSRDGSAEGSGQIDSTVFGELKLSEQLNYELSQSRIEIEALRRRLKESEQAKESFNSELKQFQSLYHSSEANCQMLRFHLLESTRKIQEMDLSRVQLEQQLQVAVELITEEENKYKLYASELHEERAQCDKLKNVAMQLENSHSILQMENTIIGEKLKGLYFAIADIAGSHFLEKKVAKEIAFLADCGAALAQDLTGKTQKIADLIEERDSLTAELKESVQNRGEMKDERDKLTKITKERVSMLQSRISFLEEENTKHVESLLKSEKRTKDLADEYEKLRLKLKQFRQKRKQYGEQDEKVCKYCQKMFSESENYNWSCRTHPSEYGSEMYWCCGRVGRDAPGCRTSKHESRDEEEEKLAQGKDESDKLQLASVQCSSCRDYGHKAGDCPKDPNFRSRFDIAEELSRVEVIMRTKKRGMETSFSTGQNVAELLLQKRSQLLFHHPNIPTSPDDSDLLSSSEEDFASYPADKAVFSEIAKLKRSIPDMTDRSLIKLHTPLEPQHRRTKSTVVVIKPADETNRNRDDIGRSSLGEGSGDDNILDSKVSEDS